MAVVAIVLVALTRPDSTSWLRSDGRSLLPPPPASALAAAERHPVTARSVTVQKVAGPTGFWVGTSPTNRMFVEVAAPPPFPVAAGQKVSFAGHIEANHPGAIEQNALVGTDADELTKQGHHVDVDGNSLRRG
jgi:hypothetical protein